MGRALQVGDYVVISEKGKEIFDDYEDRLFVVINISFSRVSGKKLYKLNMLTDGDQEFFGMVYRNEIKLYRPKKSELPKRRMTFGQWIKERVDAPV